MNEAADIHEEGMCEQGGGHARNDHIQFLLYEARVFKCYAIYEMAIDVYGMQKSSNDLIAS